MHIKPWYPFGSGLSYTMFSFANPTITPAATAGTFTVAFNVTNTGARAGQEVAQVYVADDHAKVNRPEKELKACDKVDLFCGEAKHSMESDSFIYLD